MKSLIFTSINFMDNQLDKKKIALSPQHHSRTSGVNGTRASSSVRRYWPSKADS